MLELAWEQMKAVITTMDCCCCCFELLKDRKCQRGSRHEGKVRKKEAELGGLSRRYRLLTHFLFIFYILIVFSFYYADLKKFGLSGDSNYWGSD